MPSLSSLPVAACVELCPACGHPFVTRRPKQRGRAMQHCGPECSEWAGAVATLERLAPAMLQRMTLAMLRQWRGRLLAVASGRAINRGVPRGASIRDALKVEAVTIQQARAQLVTSLEPS